MLFFSPGPSGKATETSTAQLPKQKPPEFPVDVVFPVVSCSEGAF